MGRYSRSRSRSHSRSRSRSRSLSPSEEGVRLHVADLGIDCSKREIERTFEKFGPLLEVWLARNPPCFAFIVFKYREDAEEAMREMDGKVLCGGRTRVSFARPRVRGGRRRRGFDPNLRCYQCGERGHFSRDCDEIWNYRRGGRRNDRHDRNRHRSYSRSRSRSRSRDRRSRSRSTGRGRDRKNSERKRSSSKSPRRGSSRRESKRSSSKSPRARRDSSSKQDKCKSASRSPQKKSVSKSRSRSRSRAVSVEQN